METSREAIDQVMMSRCIGLSRLAITEGEKPFASIIELDGKIVAQAMNRATREVDLSRHAEIVALSEVQKSLGADQLRRCTLYSNVEPCAMCSFCIRETGIGRVVYAIGSPVMGGVSKWKILCDDGMSHRIPQIFGPVPEIVSGLLVREAQEVWREWNPLAWQMMKLRGLLIDPSMSDRDIQVRPAHRPSMWHYLQTAVAWAKRR